MSRFLQVAGDLFRGVLEASLHASLLALAAGVLLWVLRDRVSPRVKHAAWMLVAARLCLPAGFAIPVISSLPGLHGEPAPPAEVAVFVATRGDGPVVSTAAPPAESSLTPPVVHSAAAAGSGLRLDEALALTWLAGFAFFAARVLCRAFADRQRLRALFPAADARLEEALAACARELGIPRPPPLLTGAAVAVPSLAGVFRPRLLVPADRLDRCSEGELRQIFLHELAHLKRRDIAWNWLLAVLETIHWWNPVVRWAFRRAREERELACDTVALRRAGESDARAYASALVRLVESASLGRSPVAALGLGGQRFIERRIRWIARWRDRRWSPVLSGLVLAGLAAGGLCCATTGSSDGELAVRTYHVSRIMDPPWEYPAPQFGVSLDSGGKDPPEVGERNERRLREFAESIRSSVAPGTWGRESRVDAEKGLLKVTAPESVQEKVREFLNRRLADRGPMVKLDFKFVAIDNASKLPPGVAAEVEVLQQGRRLPSRPLTAREIREIEETGRVQEPHPKLTVFNRQRSRTLVIKQAANIIGVKSSEIDGKKLKEPVIGVFNTGVVIECRAEISEDRKRATLGIEYQLVDLERNRVDVVEGVPISKPEFSKHAFALSLDAPLGEWLLANAFAATVPDDHTKLLLVKAELVAPLRIYEDREVP